MTRSPAKMSNSRVNKITGDRSTRQKYWKPLSIPGTAAYDKNNGMNELSVLGGQKLDNDVANHSLPVQEESSPPDPLDTTKVSSEAANFYNSAFGDLTEQVTSMQQLKLSTNSEESPGYSEPTYQDQEALLVGIGSLFADLGTLEHRLETGLVEQIQFPAPTMTLTEHWDTVIEANKALLCKYHNLFALCTDETPVSEALRYTAARYALPNRMWERAYLPTLNLLRDRLPSADVPLDTFLQLAEESISALQRDVPILSDHWDMITYNLREYFLTIQVSGIDVPEPYIDHWGNQYSAAQQAIRTMKTPMLGEFFGDDSDAEWMFHRYLHYSNMPGNIQATSSFGREMICETAQILMAGWLHFGRKIATSFHSFTQTFLYLGLLGAGAFHSGMNSQ